jgi:hypothetical protein
MHPHDQPLPYEGILAQAPPQAPPPATSRAGRRAAVLERRSSRLVARADEAGIRIEYLGLAPLFREPRAYAGAQTDWVIAPAADAQDAVVPQAEREALLRLDRMGIEFPLVYIAHEIPKGRLELAADPSVPAKTGPVTLDRATATQAVGPVPPPEGATRLANRLGHSSQLLLNGLRRAAPVAGAIAAAPFLLAGAAAAALAAGLDPIVFGVIPAGPATPGQPAAWYVLASWQWPSSS